jgi:multidrug efflux pump subunit AcrA (membrane-fusion protein)
VQRGDVIKELKARGRIVPVSEQRLFFRSSGYVREVYVRRNDTVKAGQILADLEIGDLENQLAQAQINVEAAQVEFVVAQQVISDTLIEAQSTLTVEQLRLEVARYYLQMEDQVPQQIAVRIQEEAVKMAELRLEKLQRGVDPRLVQTVEITRLAIERLQAQIADSSIVAPLDGQVLALNISKGDNVTAFNQTVMTLFDPAQSEVSVELLPDQLKEMAEGMTVSVKRGDQASEAWQGVVRLLPYPYGTGGRGTGDQKDTSARITIQASFTETGLDLGNMVVVQVVLENRADVLWLPPGAIRNFEGRKFVVIQEGDRQRRQNVVLGIASDDRVEIAEGLEEGQTVVSP